MRDSESVSCKVKSKVPDCVGVPEIVPPDDKVKPAGKLPDDTDQVNGGENAPPPETTNVVVG